MNRASQVLYITFSKILWSLALSYIIFACVTLNGGVVNEFLSWSFWVPLSKLSFCAYLVHYSIVDTFIYAQDHPLHTQWSIFVRFFVIFAWNNNNNNYIPNFDLIFQSSSLHSLLFLQHLPWLTCAACYSSCPLWIWKNLLLNAINRNTFLQ